MADLTGIILAAGRGTRLRSGLQVPKPLAPINNEPLLQRNLRQLHERGIKNLIVVTGHLHEQIENSAKALYPFTEFVYNPDYQEDQNILSTLLALQKVPAGQGAILIEGDVVFSEMAMNRFFHSLEPQTSIWTACGHFLPGQKGGILKANQEGFLSRIRYSNWSPVLSDWFKNLGAIFISAEALPVYAGLLREYIAKSIQQYFFVPWAENIPLLPAKIVDLGSEAGSFNTMEEYENVKRNLHTVTAPSEIALVALKALKHIEQFDPERVKWLAAKIGQEGTWTVPLAVSGEYLVMDGQHRLEAAKLLGLEKVPAVFFDYAMTPVYSLRPDITLDWQKVIENGLADNLYPYKTVKHILPSLPLCSIALNELK